MNRFRNLIALFAFSLLILALPNVASAQWNNRNNRNDDYYGNNNRNYNRNLQGTIRSLKNHASQFERRIDRELDRSRYDGKRREDRILQIARDFQDATERLDNTYDNRNDYSSSQDEARRVLQLGSQLERVLSRSQINVGSDWNRIRQDLNVLANAYNYNNNRNNRGSGSNDGYYDDDYNRNNRNNRRTTTNNRDWRRAIPFPLPF
ncbi:MAG: hypothetical protein H0U87_03420 [Acidobacteria bacterium]|jgi:hypothetical protein|nr:hypothetical protein [Acidobacteriota bacterium]